MMDDSPRDNCYFLPPECAEQAILHYGIVQVSEYRWVVVEYDGKATALNPSLGKTADGTPVGLLSWRTVSKPLRRWDAAQEAERLTLKRKR